MQRAERGLLAYVYLRKATERVGLVRRVRVRMFRVTAGCRIGCRIRLLVVSVRSLCQIRHRLKAYRPLVRREDAVGLGLTDTLCGRVVMTSTGKRLRRRRTKTVMVQRAMRSNRRGGAQHRRRTPAPNTGAECTVALAEQLLRRGTILVLARARLHSACAGAARGEAGRLLRPTKASPRST